MRIPPYYEKGSWQRFLAGGVIGGIISWIIFAYMFGVYQDIQIKHITKQADEIRNLKADIEIWKEDYKKLNEENKKGITIQEIKVKLINADKYRFDSLRQLDLESKARNDISHLIAKEISTIYDDKELIIRAIENRSFTIDDKHYQLEVRSIFLLYTNLEIQVEMKFKDEK
jgi:hypothetical protein